MFPTANSHIYRNEMGEVLGWDNPSSYGDEEYGEDFHLEMEYEDRFYVPDYEPDDWEASEEEWDAED